MKTTEWVFFQNEANFDQRKSEADIRQISKQLEPTFIIAFFKAEFDTGFDPIISASRSVHLVPLDDDDDDGKYQLSARFCTCNAKPT